MFRRAVASSSSLSSSIATAAAAAAVKMLRLRSRVIQLSSGCGADWLSLQSHQHLTSRHVCPRVITSSMQRRYASAENVEYKPIKKLLVANRGKIIGYLLRISERNCCNSEMQLSIVSVNIS